MAILKIDLITKLILNEGMIPAFSPAMIRQANLPTHFY